MSTAATTTTATATKARRSRKPANNAEIRVRLSAKTKDKAARLFKRHGLSAADGVRRLIDSAIAGDDPWLACKMSSHIPNAETRRALEADVMPLPEGGLAQLWDEVDEV